MKIKIIITCFLFLSIYGCTKQSIQKNNIETVKNMAILSHIDTIIGGYVGDYYQLNNQNLFIVNNTMKKYQSEVTMTGTVSYHTTGNDSNSGGGIEVICSGTASNCVDCGEYIIIRDK